MYSFEISVGDESQEESALVIFSGQIEGSSQEYATGFERHMADRLRPDYLIFVFPGYLKKIFAEFLRDDPAVCGNLTRFGSRTSVLAFAFDKAGSLSKVRIRNPGKGRLKIDTQDLCRAIVTAGLYQLAERRKEEVILQAPPGAHFAKPSRGTSEEFIRAGALTNDYVEHQFLAFCLLTRAPSNIDIRSIHIDTGSIAAVAEAVSYYLHKFSDHLCKPVLYKTFSSYEGLERERPDSTVSAWVIISASFTNNLGRKIAKEWGLESNQVITILTYANTEDDGKGGGALVNIKKLSSTGSNVRAFDVRRQIRIVGENFTSEIASPVAVMLKAEHKPKNLDGLMKLASRRGIFHCHKRGGQRSRAIYLDFESTLLAYADAGKSELQKWVRRSVEWYVPRNFEWLIFDTKDPSHCSLFELVRDTLRETGFPHSCKIRDINADRLDVSGSGAALILSPVISNGRGLSRINRELRLGQHDGNRIFLVPFALPSSSSVLDTLRRSICFGPNGFRYQFVNFLVLSCGHAAIGDSWDREMTLIENAKHSIWHKRRKVLARLSAGLGEDLGVCRGGLSLTQDFAFWEGYSDNPASAKSAAVYVTIAATIQRLREKDPWLDQDSLRSFVYHHAVIDPANFVRFSDPLIQACIWRSAEGGELDYRRTDDLSEAMLQILKRSLGDFEQKKQSAFIDLLIGIAIGRIRLTKPCIEILLNEIGKSRSTRALLHDLIEPLTEFAKN